MKDETDQYEQFDSALSAVSKAADELTLYHERIEEERDDYRYRIEDAREQFYSITKAEDLTQAVNMAEYLLNRCDKTLKAWRRE